MIAHIDADSFFASVLVRQSPRLRGKPLLALGMGGGFVIAASYEAKAKGIRTGTPLKEAMRLCPDAIRMPSDFHETGLASEQIESVIREHCPIVEQMSIDEWYLDLNSIVSGVPADPDIWGRTIQKTILDKTGLSVSVGIGPSKLLAKMAGEYRKPSGVTAVGMLGPLALRIEEFLRDRPAPAIPGIGRRRQPHVATHGWETAWDIAAAPTDLLVSLFGRPGSDMQRELLGEMLSPVDNEHHAPKSVSRARSFRRETNPRTLWAHLLRHAEYTVLKMRRHELACRGVSVWLRDERYRWKSAHTSLPQPTCTEEALHPYLRRCLRQVHDAHAGYTQIGMALWRLGPAGSVQYSLFEDAGKICRDEDVQKTLDRLHEKYGRNTITRGAAMEVRSGTKRGFDMPAY